MTNYERIKQFTLEQMWQFLCYYAIGDIDTAKTFCDLCERDAREHNESCDCDGCVKWWLGLPQEAPQGLADTIYPWNCTMDELPSQAKVIPVEEVSDKVDEAIRTLNAINSRGNERFDYADYCELYDAIADICPKEETNE